MEKEIAYKILYEHFTHSTYLNIALNHTLENMTLTPKQKRKITFLVYGVIQHYLTCMYQLEPHIHTRIKLYEKVLLVLSMYEHLYSYTPDYAIVDTSVRIAKKRSMTSAKRINAILKKSFENERSYDGLDGDERLSIMTSHPLWIVKMFVKQYGYDVTEKICLSNNEPSINYARVNTLLTTKDEILKNKDFKDSSLSKDALIYTSGNIANTKEYKEGYVTVQDIGSQEIAHYLNPEPGSYVLDMCGAPGNKTTHLAQIMNNTGHIDVYDIYEHKIQLIIENYQRLHITNIHAHLGDALEIPDHQYDSILLDAPCSGLGVLGRKPEIRYHSSSVMDELIPLQEKLLEKAYVLCKKSGKILYSTCTLNKKENEKQIECFLEKHTDIEKIQEKTILPYINHTDGFYICLLRKK